MLSMTLELMKTCNPAAASGLQLTTCLFLATWSLTAVLVHALGPFPRAALFTRHNSRFYAFASFLLLVLILSPIPEHDGPARTVYHLSKIYEYIDILGVCAAGGTIGLHFGFHHLTTPWLTFVRVLQDGAGSEGWRWFAAANAAHHALMYAYFGGWSGVRDVCVWTGQVQLVVGMVVDLWIVWGRLVGEERGEVVWRHLFSAGLLATYCVLSLREMRSGANEEGKKGKAGKQA